MAEVMSAVRENLESGVEPVAPGGVVVVRRGTRVEAVAFGRAVIRPQRIMRRDDRFQIGSVTKPMVAALVLQLIDDGDLALDMDVEDIVPGLLPTGRDITVEQLLSHRSGLHNYTDTTSDLGRHWRPRQIVRIASDQPLLFQPGTRSSYSNTNYVVLGVIAEKVTGLPVERLLQTRIFGPSGMRATSLDPTRATEAPRAHGYEDGGDVTANDLSLAWAAGGVVSTADDVTRFLDALFHGRLGADLVGAMTTSRGRLEQTGAPYGLGLTQLPTACGTAWGHEGAITGYAADAWSTRDGTRSVVLLVNHTGHDHVVSGVVDAALCD